jgi:hypothetical protein
MSVKVDSNSLDNFKKNSCDFCDTYSDYRIKKLIKQDVLFIEMKWSVFCFQIYMDEAE